MIEKLGEKMFFFKKKKEKKNMATARMYFLFGNLDMKVKYFFEKKEFLLEKIDIEKLGQNIVNNGLDDFFNSKVCDDFVIFLVDIIATMNDILVVIGQINSKKDVVMRFTKLLDECKEINIDVLENIKRITKICDLFEKLLFHKIEFFTSLVG